MGRSSDVVTGFLARCAQSKAEMEAAFRTVFTPETRWENVGFAATVGADEALALMGQFEAGSGAVTFSAEIVNIAENGPIVMTERVESLLDADGRVTMTFRLMGVFEVSADRITAWRDYFDTAVFAR